MVTFIAIFVGVAALIFAGGAFFSKRPQEVVEERLDSFTQSSVLSFMQEGEAMENSLLLEPFDEDQNVSSLERALSRFGDIRKFVHQSDVKITVTQLVLLSIALAAAGGGLGFLTPIRVIFGPLFAATLGAAPFAYVWFKRRQRLSAFESQLPEAMELLARALRAGHSLADGINLVGEEMSAPIATEFARVYEQQNLGLMLEDALQELAERVPNMDLRFFVTAIVLQRQTGGDAAEVLDKIGRLIRERFQIRGQIKALTGEGRLSGVVLLALPIVLAIYMYFRNPDYLMLLFEDPIGQKMVGGAVIAQILGALVIRKIVNIKV